jgi:hypothetical protein
MSDFISPSLLQLPSRYKPGSQEQAWMVYTFHLATGDCQNRQKVFSELFYHFSLPQCTCSYPRTSSAESTTATTFSLTIDGLRIISAP